jgi:hypothetical protein
MGASEGHMRLTKTATLLCLVICSGCHKAPSRQFVATFDVQPSPDGRNIGWYLHFSEAQYHAMLEFTRDGGETAKVRELIAAGLSMHHLSGCEAREQTVTRLKNDGIAFVGLCSPAHQWEPAGAI